MKRAAKRQPSAAGRTKRKSSPVSDAEERLAAALAADPLPGWDLVREHPFHERRRWRFDFAFPSQRLAVEVEGRYHCTYAGHRSDCEKLNEAIRQGWRVLRFPAAQKARAAEWAELIREVLLAPPEPPA